MVSVRCRHGCCERLCMPQVLVCSHNPIFLKHYYGTLRTDGFGVDTTDHTAQAVRMALNQPYSAVVLDGGCIGLNADEARHIIQSATGIPVIIAGTGDSGQGAVNAPGSVDLQGVRRLLQSVCQSPMERR